MRTCLIATLAAAAMVGATAVAQNNSQFSAWKPAALADAVQARPKAACASLVALTGYELSVTTATVVAASPQAPEHCRISGQILPEVRFQLNLPASWDHAKGRRSGPVFEDLKRARREQGWEIHAIAKFEDLLEFARSFSRRHYAPKEKATRAETCLLYTSPSPRDRQKSRMPSSA